MFLSWKIVALVNNYVFLSLRIVTLLNNYVNSVPDDCCFIIKSCSFVPEYFCLIMNFCIPVPGDCCFIINNALLSLKSVALL